MASVMISRLGSTVTLMDVAVSMQDATVVILADVVISKPDAMVVILKIEVTLIAAVIFRPGDMEATLADVVISKLGDTAATLVTVAVGRRTQAEELSTQAVEGNEPITGLTTGDLTDPPLNSVDPQQSPEVLIPEHPDELHVQAYGPQTVPR
ncbi:hypothetical protein M422DRAFT_274989 [Sphaerobolus stellatus SS14]|uniref:Uncharacterized protein n=1 Tax=Sphaerobolus stellatus (strain SS14) TaxID=990650 RepID=A0A0C9TQT4_SPHS4|nr:hypothetical protein M422DRAFT_274989 [Sphaerobolus stellatus SS14]